MIPEQKATDEATSLRPTGPGQLALLVRGFLDRDVIVVLLVALAARLIWMLVLPPQARAADVHNWEGVADALAAGQNPYQTTTFLNYPPFWLQLIFVLSKISTAFSVQFFHVLQVFFILVESVVIGLLIRLIREIAPAARVCPLVMVGIALNPAAILLICQHCQFDIIVTLWVMLFLLSLLRYHRTGNYADWLCACLFLGLGILTKIVPLVLAPLLAGGFRQATLRLRFLGLVVLFGPVAFGMSVIFVLAPAGVFTSVLEYRSIAGVFGVSGLLRLAGVEQVTSSHKLVFYLLIFAFMTAGSISFWRRQFLGDRQTVLLTALVLAAIPALGPGYCPNYLYWFMPFLVASFAVSQGKWRWVLIGFGLIVACTYLVEYALVGTDGAFLLNISIYKLGNLHPSPRFLRLVAECSSNAGQTLIRLPLFLAYLAVLAVGTGVLLEDAKDRTMMVNRRMNWILQGRYWLIAGVLLAIELGIWLPSKPSPPLPDYRDFWELLDTNRLVVDASKGNVIAEYNLGRAYQVGFGFTQDMAQAAIWYQRSAAQGHLESQNALGMLLATYRQDYAGAARWFGRAATNGNADAQYNLGVLYHKGMGVGQNDEMAAQWFQKAADQHHTEAEKELGRLYQSGQGVKQDYVAAYKWLKLAQLQGDEQATNELKACSALMAPEQIAAAEKQVQAFKAAGK